MYPASNIGPGAFVCYDITDCDDVLRYHWLFENLSEVVKKIVDLNTECHGNEGRRSCVPMRRSVKMLNQQEVHE